MDCNGNIYNIGMGCCEPMLGPIENYYTKPATDRRIQEEISGISAVTIDEVQEMIDEAVSGKQDTLIAGDGIIIDENNVISTSGSVTEEKMNEAIASAKTEIEAEIPSLDGYATEQWVEDKHYITGVDLSNYATKDNLTAATDDMATQTWVNNQGFLTEHQSLSAYSTTQEMNTAISQAVSGKQDTLSAGTGIDITDNVISTTGGGTSYSAGRGIDIDSGNTISFTLPISGVNNSSIIEGFSGNTVSNYYSHAEGLYTKANGMYSHAEGYFTKTENAAEHASGQYNMSNKASATFGDSGNTLFSVGNGTAYNARHNVLEIRQNGDIYIQSGSTDILLQDSLVTSTEKTTWNSKPNVWCGDETAWGQISGGTLDPQCIYLVY